MVPGAGIEPARPCGLRILSPVRLPVSPPRREVSGLIVSMIYAVFGLACPLAFAPLSPQIVPKGSSPARVPLVFAQLG